MESTMEKHVTVLGALYVAFGILGALLAAVIFTAIAGGGILSGDGEAIAITASIATVLSAFLLLLSAPLIIAGAGLLRRARWSRVMALILGCLHLMNIPFGTALGIYTLWVLLHPATLPMFEKQSVTEASGPAPQPPELPHISNSELTESSL